jgi:SAM-dependent methyltransferase
MTESTDLRTTRDSYDTVAASYAELVKLDLERTPYDRAMLGEFVELVRESGPVGDIGCGPGHVTAYLDASGVSAFGIDLSPAMVEIARKKNPALRFAVGSMTKLELADGGLGGVLSWYSIVHMALEQLPTVFAELFRVLAPGGHLLLAFKAGDRKSPAEPRVRARCVAHRVLAIARARRRTVGAGRIRRPGAAGPCTGRDGQGAAGVHAGA